eukprot:TRINITY_DN4904_c0_g1_i1.p1 TRINITY_DN4904_c0_g1~~TRINITY_DN4904_c0_g1_i1.p1  ORF type:complete len:268 (-),score=39.08 TRINITY_DN4904_c0_g1_i1:421-1224(-)
MTEVEFHVEMISGCSAMVAGPPDSTLRSCRQRILTGLGLDSDGVKTYQLQLALGGDEGAADAAGAAHDPRERVHHEEHREVFGADLPGDEAWADLLAWGRTEGFDDLPVLAELELLLAACSKVEVDDLPLSELAGRSVVVALLPPTPEWCTCKRFTISKQWVSVGQGGDEQGDDDVCLDLKPCGIFVFTEKHSYCGQYNNMWARNELRAIGRWSCSECELGEVSIFLTGISVLMTEDGLTLDAVKETKSFCKAFSKTQLDRWNCVDL